MCDIDLFGQNVIYFTHIGLMKLQYLDGKAVKIKGVIDMTKKSKSSYVSDYNFQSAAEV